MPGTPSSSLNDRSSDDLTSRATRASEVSADLAKRSEAALAKLHALSVHRSTPPTPSDPDIEPEPWEAESASSTRQMHRHHVVIVNSDPTFLDVARVLLQGNRYNVTTTNLVPRTHDMVQAAGVDVLVIDLTIGQPQIWRLLEQIRDGEQTRSLPVVLTSVDSALLDHAQATSWPPGGRFLLLKPFAPDDLLDVIHALIGPA